MFVIAYPHPRKNDLQMMLKRFGVGGVMGLATMEACGRNCFAITRRLLQDRAILKRGRIEYIQKVWRELQEDPEHMSSMLYDKYSGINKFIRVKAATSHALEMHYTYDEHVQNCHMDSVITRYMSDLWMKHSASSRAIRNRYAVVVQLLMEVCVDMMEKYGEVQIFSLASGSARAVVDALKAVHICYPHNRIAVLLVDFDPTALKKARADIERDAPFVEFTAKVGNVYRLEKITSRVEEFAPNIIEMIGFLDYIDDHQAPRILRRLYDFEPDHFMTCNVIPTLEAIALHAVVMWPRMVYRTTQELSMTLSAGGFCNADIYAEPYHIHAVAHWHKEG